MDQLEELNKVLARFKKAEADLEEFSERNPDLMQELRELSDQYNDSLAMLEKMARSTGQTLGPIKVLRTSAKVNVERLERLLGRSRILEIGGKEEVTVKIGAAQLRKAADAGDIDNKIIDACVEEVVSFNVPKPKVIP